MSAKQAINDKLQQGSVAGKHQSDVRDTEEVQLATFRATLIFHLIDGLLSTTAAHEVRRAGVLTCGSCHLERSARQNPHRG